MKTRREVKIEELLQHLDRLDASSPAPERRAIVEVSRVAIMDELALLLREHSQLQGLGLSVYRSGGNLDAISMAS